MRFTAFLLTLTLIGCAGFAPKDETVGWPADKLYNEAHEAMQDGNYEKAVKYYEILEARYPYGRYAQQAQIEIAYAYYKDEEAASAIAAADRFIKLHPNHPNVDYMYYLKGLANFIENTGFFKKLSGQDTSERDPKSTQDSFQAFKELVTLFPNSKYTPDAIARMKFLSNALATHEVRVANYYYRRKAYVAAVNHAQLVIQNYQQAPATEEAMALIVRSYDALGIKDLRDDAKRVLDKNFPNSVYLTKDYDTKRWWKLW
jgi:outer membrane protein assembly factor BamD